MRDPPTLIGCFRSGLMDSCKCHLEAPFISDKFVLLLDCMTCLCNVEEVVRYVLYCIFWPLWMVILVLCDYHTYVTNEKQVKLLLWKCWLWENKQRLQSNTVVLPFARLFVGIATKPINMYSSLLSSVMWLFIEVKDGHYTIRGSRRG